MSSVPSGLERSRRLQAAAAGVSEPAGKVLSWLVSNLVHRGWLSPLDKLLDPLADQVDLSVEAVRTAASELQASGLLELDDGRIATLAGLFSTRQTGLDFALADGHTVHLLDPLAALAAGVALQRSGEVRALCPESQQRLVLDCDASGVVSRHPETLCAFLPGEQADTKATGGFFADDDALGQWQEKAGDPAGMPLTSFVFPMVAADLGQELGAALAPTLGHLPDFA